jgi:hypothetical protein
MLQKLGDHIANCLAQATVAERRASETSDETLRGDYERLAKTWRHLANSYLFVESLERFLLDADKAKRASLLHPANENRDPVPHPAAIAFGPETIAVLTTAYERAIDSNPTSAHEAIARRIIELASEGERDPDKLCQGALAPCMRTPQARPRGSSFPTRPQERL